MEIKGPLVAEVCHVELLFYSFSSGLSRPPCYLTPNFLLFNNSLYVISSILGFKICPTKLVIVAFGQPHLYQLNHTYFLYGKGQPAMLQK